MAAKIFITGGTGFIGGSVLDTTVKNHPEYVVTAFLRNEPANFKALYPNVKVVKGDYDSTEILSIAASKADMVVHCGDSDHEPSINALIAGLTHPSRTSAKPGFLIHLSGTALVSDWSEPSHHGHLNPHIWSDIQDLEAITSRPDFHLHRNVDKIIQDAASEHGERLKTAIVCPPDIYGGGRGPGKRQSVFLPMFFELVRKEGRAFYVGEGANRRSWVHLEDLMRVYLRLVEAAVEGGGGADWGREGYYFTSTQEVSQLDLARAVGRLLHSRGQIETSELKSMSVEDVNKLVDYPKYPMLGTYLFASNSRTVPHRAEKCFGYEPQAPSLWETLEADLDACN